MEEKKERERESKKKPGTGNKEDAQDEIIATIHVLKNNRHVKKRVVTKQSNSNNSK